MKVSSFLWYFSVKCLTLFSDIVDFGWLCNLVFTHYLWICSNSFLLFVGSSFSQFITLVYKVTFPLHLTGIYLLQYGEIVTSLIFKSGMIGWSHVSNLAVLFQIIIVHSDSHTYLWECVKMTPILCHIDKNLCNIPFKFIKVWNIRSLDRDNIWVPFEKVYTWTSVDMFKSIFIINITFLILT